jgi:hypothetical protein
LGPLGEGATAPLNISWTVFPAVEVHVDAIGGQPVEAGDGGGQPLGEVRGEFRAAGLGPVLRQPLAQLIGELRQRAPVDDVGVVRAGRGKEHAELGAGRVVLSPLVPQRDHHQVRVFRGLRVPPRGRTGSSLAIAHPGSGLSLWSFTTLTGCRLWTHSGPQTGRSDDVNAGSAVPSAHG